MSGTTNEDAAPDAQARCNQSITAPAHSSWFPRDRGPLRRGPAPGNGGVVTNPPDGLKPMPKTDAAAWSVGYLAAEQERSVARFTMSAIRW